MSYILDALRRADSERERGAIPGIHAQPVLPGSADGEAHRAAQPALWIAVGLSLALLGVWAWNRVGSDAPAELAQPAAAPIAAAAPAPAAVETAPTLPERSPAAARRTAAPAPPAIARPAAKPAAQAQAPNADNRVYKLDQLPEDIRRDLPAIALGGSIYSDNPANRFLIINGQTFRENEKVAADLTLEQIQLKAAVLRFRGYRYSVAY